MTSMNNTTKQQHIEDSERYIIDRPIFTQQDLDSNYGSKYVKKTFTGDLLYNATQSKSCCNRDQWSKFSLRFFPFVGIMKKYKWRTWLINDLIAGVTVGLMHISQGMANAMIAELPPVLGLYSSIFPSLVYFFLGTSRHISIGVTSALCFMTGSLLDAGENMRMAAHNSTGVNNVTNEYVENIEDRLALLTAITIIVGLIQIGMGILHLGYLTRYLSEPLISGFTVGVAVKIVTYQISPAFGFQIKKNPGVFNVPKTIYAIFTNMQNTNLPTMGISLISIFLLILFKELINPIVRAKLRIPIPIELFVIICGTTASYFLDLASQYNVKIIGDIPRGLPMPVLPQLDLASPFIPGCFAIAIIGCCMSISLGKIFAKKHAYEINSNQELLALGLSTFASSIFICTPVTSSLSRSSVQDSMGGKTQLTSIFSSLLLVFILYVVGPLFKYVPKCCMAAAVIVSMKDLLLLVKELPLLWKYSFWDFWCWVLTCLVVINIEVEYGLLAGICFAMLTVVLRTQSPYASILGNFLDTDIYKYKKGYVKCKEVEGIKIFRYEGALFYACADHFMESLFKKTTANPRKLLKKKTKISSKLKAIDKELNKLDSSDLEVGSTTLCCFNSCPGEETQDIEEVYGHTNLAVINDSPVNDISETNFEVEITVKRDSRTLVTSESTQSQVVMGQMFFGNGDQFNDGNVNDNSFVGVKRENLEIMRKDLLIEMKGFIDPPIHHIILDCSTWGYIDFMGVITLNQVIQAYKKVSIKVLLANPKFRIRQMFDHFNFYKHHKSIIYASIHDAVLAAKYVKTKDLYRHSIVEEITTF